MSLSCDMLPVVGIIFLESKFNNVVFPDPLLPINPILSDFFTRREIFLKIIFPAKSKHKLFNLINFVKFFHIRNC